jgi:SRSO17 transposase
VRHFEPFTALHLGVLAETRRKTLPRLGQTVHADPQALHHFLAHAEWSVEALRQRRRDLLRQAVGQTPFIVGLDETGDRKQGHPTDDVATQSIGNRHTRAHGIVSVNAYGVLGSTTFPLLFRVFKPQTRLTAGDGDQTQPQLAIEIIRDHPRSSEIIEELLRLGFRFSVVLADSRYGDSGPFLRALHRLRVQ